VFALLSASPFGAVIDIPRFLSESLGVVEKSVSLADDVLDVGQESVTKLKAEKGNFDNVVSEFQSLVDQANSQVSSGLDSVQQSVNDYGAKINDYGTAMKQFGTDAVSKADQYGANMVSNVNHMNTDIDNSLKKYQNQSRMIGGRINKSASDFFSSGNSNYNYKNEITRKHR
jgi:ABC-type transporter Mla subunit MlaD